MFKFTSIELTSHNALQLLVNSGFFVEEKWTKLLSHLDVTPQEIEKLKTSERDYKIALEKGIQWWITNGTSPCWEKLISAVESCGDKSIATTLRRQLDIKNEGIYYI